MNTVVRIASGKLPVRQGDVLLIPVVMSSGRDRCTDDWIGEQIRRGNSLREVLAHGEATGHAHAIYPQQDALEGVSDQCKWPAVYEVKERWRHLVGVPFELLRLQTRALLRHEEHESISLPAGDWLLVRQHEGDEVEALRRVAD